MAVSLLSREVSDLCIGKPPLRQLPPSATVGDAVIAFRQLGEPCLSVWLPDRSTPEKKSCAGKVCMVDVLCYLCADTQIKDPAGALRSPVTVLLHPKDAAALVRRVEPHSSVLEALDVILDGGAQNLVVPIRSGGGSGRKKLHNPEFCWLAQEDFLRYFFNSIGHFSSFAALSVTALGLVRADVLAIRHHEPALAALPLIRRALLEQTSVAVVTDDGKLIGEISPSTLAGCDVTVAAALAALSTGDLMAYIDCSGAPPEGAVRAIKGMLKEKGMEGMLQFFEEEEMTPESEEALALVGSLSPSSSSSDEECTENKRRQGRPRRQRSGSYSARMGRRSEEAIVCHPGSSLVAVMVQALAHRVSYAWVVEENYDLVGVVALQDVLKMFGERL